MNNTNTRSRDVSKNIASRNNNKSKVLTIDELILIQAEEAATASRLRILEKLKEGTPERKKLEASFVLIPLKDKVTEAMAALEKFREGIKPKELTFLEAITKAKAEVSKKALEIGTDDPYRARNTTGGKSKVDGDTLYEYLSKEGDKSTSQIGEHFGIKGKQTLRKWFDTNGAKYEVFVSTKGNTKVYSVKKPS